MVSLVVDYDDSAVTASVCRSTVQSGLPLASYRTSKTSQAEQLDTLSQRHLDAYFSYLDDNNVVGDMDMYYSSSALDADAEHRALVFSFYLAIGSLLVVLAALWVYTESLLF
jgi:hypothetical protein